MGVVYIMREKEIKCLEEKYGIKIVGDSFYNPLTKKYHKLYRMYSADGCWWDNGLTYNELQAECEKNAEVLLKIKEECKRHAETPLEIKEHAIKH